LTSGSDLFSRHAADNRVWFDIPGNHCARADYGASADRHVRQYHSIRGDPYIVMHGYFPASMTLFPDGYGSALEAMATRSHDDVGPDENIVSYHNLSAAICIDHYIRIGAYIVADADYSVSLGFSGQELVVRSEAYVRTQAYIHFSG